MRLIVLISLILSCVQIAFTQPLRTTLQGTVADSLSQSILSRATVLLIAQGDSSQTKIQLTDPHGHFTFGLTTLKEYKLQISHVGYRTWSRLVRILNTGVQLDTVCLVPQIQHLNEISVRSSSPVRIRQDTVEYKTDSLIVSSTGVLAELLKKLPGLEIRSDGMVIAHGQIVQQIYVDGKPFFGSDLRIATQNLPASLIKAVQVYDKRSDKSIFSGIEDGSRSKMINIVTKPEGRQGIFGQQAAGSGTDNRYQVGLSVNKFSKDQQISLLGQTNNINQSGYSLAMQSARTNLTDFANNTQGQPSGITQSVGGGINYSNKWGKRLEVNTHYLFSKAKTQISQATLRQTILSSTGSPSDSFARQSVFITKNDFDNMVNASHQSLSLRLSYRPNVNNVIQFSPTLSLSSQQITSTVTAQTQENQHLLNQSNAHNNSIGTSLSADNTILWMHRFKQAGRTFSVEMKSSFNNQNSDGAYQSQNIFYPKLNSSDTIKATEISQGFNQQTNLVSNEWNFTYSEPISSKHSLVFRYQQTSKHGDTRRKVIEMNPYTSITDLSGLLSNNYQSDLKTSRVGTNWQVRQPTYTSTLGLDVQQIKLHSVSRPENWSYLNLFPNLTLQPKLASNHYLQFQYQSQVIAPTVLQLQPVPNVTNPLIIQVGNPALRPEYSHQAGFVYNSFESTTNRTVFAQLNTVITRHRIINSTRIDSFGVQTIQPVNANGYMTVSGSLSLGRPVMSGAINGTLNLITNLSIIRGVSLINDQANRLLTIQTSQGVTLNTAIKDLLEASFSVLINYQTATYSLQNAVINHSVNGVGGVQLYCQLPLGFKVATDMKYSVVNGRFNGYNQHYIQWNSYLSRAFFTRQQGELRIQAFDLLNQNRVLTRTVTDTYVEDVQGSVLKRYLLVTFVYNLRQFGRSQ